MCSPTKRQFWTHNEDALLLQFYEENGPNWIKL